MISLREMDLSDVTETYIAWVRDPAVNRWLGTHTATLESQRAWVAQWLGRKDAALFAICCREAGCIGQMIGSLKLELPPPGEAAVLGLMLGDRDHWNRGMGTAAIELGTRLAFHRWPEVRRVEAAIRPQHFASLRAFERAGYTVDWPEKLWARVARLPRRS